jgi:hypothetical protein
MTKRVPEASNDNPQPITPKAIEPSIDLIGAKKIKLVPHVGGGVTKDIELHMIFADISSGTVQTRGALRVTSKQWEQLKRDGDRILEAHRKLLRRQALE